MALFIQMFSVIWSNHGLTCFSQRKAKHQWKQDISINTIIVSCDMAQVTLFTCESKKDKKRL